MEARFLLLTPHDGLLAHLKEVDKWWIGLNKFFRLHGKRQKDFSHTDTRNASLNDTQRNTQTPTATAIHLPSLTYLRMMSPTLLSSDQFITSSSRSACQMRQPALVTEESGRQLDNQEITCPGSVVQTEANPRTFILVCTS